MKATKTHSHFIVTLLSSSLLVLGACQAQNPEAHQLGSVQPIQAVQDQTWSGRLELRPQADRTRVITLHLNGSTSDFRTQTFDCSKVDHLDLKVEGIGISPPITATATASGACDFTSSPIGGIPAGNNRVVTAVGKDVGGNSVPGGQLYTALNISDSNTSSSEISYRTSPLGKILLELMSRGDEGKLRASLVDNGALQTFVDTLTGYTLLTTAPPVYSYTTHPLLLNPVVIADAIMAEAVPGSLPASPPTGFAHDPGSVTVNLSGLNPGLPLEVAITDPASGVHYDAVAGAPSPSITINNVLPGNWTLFASNVAALNTSVAVTSGNNTSVNLDFTNVGPNWLQTGGPEAAEVTSLVRTADGDILMGSKSGVFRSTDGGDTWASVNTGLSALATTRLATDPNDTTNAEVLVGTEDGRVFKRSFKNGDSSWTQVGSTVAGSAITMLFIDPDNTSRFFAGTEFSGLFEFDTAWTAVNTGLPTGPMPRVTSMVKDTTNLQFYLGLHDGGVYKTTTADNPSLGWAAQNTNLNCGSGDCQVNDLLISNTGSALLMGADNGQVFASSTLTGLVWGSASAGIGGGNSVRKLAISGSTLFAATANGLKSALMSSFVPGTWSNAEAGGNPYPPTAPMNPFMTALVANSAGEAVTGTAGAGVNIWSGSAWRNANVGVHAAFVRALIKGTGGDTAIYAATEGSGVHRSTDGGASWTPMLNVAATGQERYVSALAVKAETGTVYDLFMGSGDGVFWLNDVDSHSSPTNGWAALDPSNLPGTKADAVLVNSNGLVLAGNDNGLFKICEPGSGTCTGLSTWTQTGSGTVNQAYSLARKPDNPNYIYAGGSEKVYVSTDITNPAAWSSHAVGGTGATVRALAVSSADTNVVYAGYDNVSGPVFVSKSTDAGLNWSNTGNFPAGLTGVFSLQVDPIDANVVYAGTNDGVYVSIDGGSNWSAFNAGTDGLGGHGVAALMLDGLQLYAGTKATSVSVSPVAITPVN